MPHVSPVPEEFVPLASVLRLEENGSLQEAVVFSAEEPSAELALTLL